MALVNSIKNKAYNIATGIVVNRLQLRPIATGKIRENLYAVRTGTVNFFIYRKNENLICIDSGFGKSAVLRGLEHVGIDPNEVTHLFLTHSDFDHADGLPAFEKAEIYLSGAEEPMITRQQARMWGFIYNSKLKRSYQVLKDNDVVRVGSIKVQAIATPGHTTGSMSYLIDGSILFVGDTFKLKDDMVYAKRPYINMDTDQQKASIRRLAQLPHVALACTAHNGYTEEFDHAMSKWK